MKIGELYQKCKHYVMETENPLIQIFYIAIAPVAYVFYAYFIYFNKFDILGIWHVLIANIISFTAFYNYVKAWKSNPGKIGEHNHVEVSKNHKDFYDGFAFIENQSCSTCNLVK